LLSQKSSNLSFCMYKYKSWQNVAARPVASLDEEHLTITKPSPVHHPLPHPKPVTTFPTPSNVLPHTSSAQSIVPRRPQAGRELIPSSLHPHVAAVDRIHHWQTPHSRSFNSQVASYLPTNLVNSSFEMIYRSLAPATRSTYGAGLLLNSVTNTISPNLTTCLLHSFSSSPSSVNTLGLSLAKPSPGGSLALKLGTTQTLLSGVVTRGGYKWHASPLKKKAQPSTKKCTILSLLTTSPPFTTVSIFLTLPMLPVGLFLLGHLSVRPTVPSL
jgi:hypothetical protein